MELLVGFGVKFVDELFDSDFEVGCTVGKAVVEGIGLGVAVEVELGVGEGVGVGVGVATGVGVGLEVGLGLAVTEGVGVGEVEGCGESWVLYLSTQEAVEQRYLASSLTQVKVGK